MPRGVAVGRDVWDAASVARHELAWPIRAHAARFAASPDWPSIDELNDTLADALAGSARFVPCPPRRRHRRAAPITAKDLYDGRIALDGEVPTRLRSWHDFFNALVWATWPRAKRRLHERQHEAIAARVAVPTWRLPPTRTPELHRLAMLDEGGVVLLAAPGEAAGLRAALAQGDDAAVARAVSESSAELLVFGHALYDHLREGGGQRLFARAEVVPAPTDLPPDRATRLAVADETLARALEDRRAPEPVARASLLVAVA